MSVREERQELCPKETAKTGKKRESKIPMTQHRNQYQKEMRVEDSAAVGDGSQGESDALELPQQEHPRDHKNRERSSLLRNSISFCLQTKQ